MAARSRRSTPVSYADPRIAGIVLIAAHFFVEDQNIASIAAIRTEYETTGLRARLARLPRRCR